MTTLISTMAPALFAAAKADWEAYLRSVPAYLHPMAWEEMSPSTRASLAKHLLEKGGPPVETVPKICD